MCNMFCQVAYAMEITNEKKKNNLHFSHVVSLILIDTL